MSTSCCRLDPRWSVLSACPTRSDVTGAWWWDHEGKRLSLTRSKICLVQVLDQQHEVASFLHFKFSFLISLWRWFYYRRNVVTIRKAEDVQLWVEIKHYYTSLINDYILEVGCKVTDFFQLPKNNICTDVSALTLKISDRSIVKIYAFGLSSLPVYFYRL